ncbi:hypothetical protein WICPIJ_002144 [Wickerhamomyces pijperi]|uniref:Uncharacterized protein n=1 Tax=Wickerhamomyces pijperi TaxID=599730 RepID=A0A9P8QC03_WICPI|nr:hypothetical protein WICPIJ_002144 [Wickerhamomyces pijperi]
MTHGESEGNCDKSVNRYIPNHKVPLTALGHTQAQQAGVQLKELLKEDDSVLFYTSPYKRTRQTLDGLVAGIKDTGVSYKIHEEPRMREQDFGNFQSSAEDMEIIWKERAHYGHFFYRIPHGESAADVYDRCAGFNETLFRQFQSEKFPSVLVLVTHGIWARVFLMKWYRWTYEEFESFTNIPHCQFLIMEKNPDTERYKLLTRLYKWDDEEDSDENDATKEGEEEQAVTHKLEREEERYEQEIKCEVMSNSNSYTDMKFAQHSALARKSQKEKEKKIRELFKQSMDSKNNDDHTDEEEA